VPSASSIAALSGTITIGLAGGARAGDGEQAVSTGLGYATYAAPDPAGRETLTPTGGIELAAGYERGFGEAAGWRVRGTGALYAGGGLAGTGTLTIGLTYRLDVLRYVPYVAVGVGALVRGGGPLSTQIEPALEITAGVDWLRSRSRSWGIEAGVTGFARDTTTVSVGLRTTWRWGYF